MLRTAKKKPVQRTTQKRNFSHNIHNVSKDCIVTSGSKQKVVYRGIRNNVYDDKSSVPLFRAECILFGLSSYYMTFDPKKVIIDNDLISGHKMSPIFLSTTLNKEIARTFTHENSPLLTFDVSNLNNLTMINAESAFAGTYAWFYAGGQENELTVFALLYASIKFFEFKNYQAFSNPFYLPICPNDQESCLLLNELYEDLCKLHHNGRSQGGKPTVEYLEKFNLLYHNVLGDQNPLNMTLTNFQRLFPQYAKHFFHVMNGANYDRFFAVKTSNRADKITVFNFLLGNLSMKEYAFCIDPTAHRVTEERDAVSRICRDNNMKKKFNL